ncbi:hypothetical protein PLESTF_001212700 [Pleodorina starrii]|nr:hypothetical protein PLESTF_001212700 [Pleodorina starrii]
MLNRPPYGDACAPAATVRAGADVDAGLNPSTASDGVLPLAPTAAPPPQPSSMLQGDTPAVSPTADLDDADANAHLDDDAAASTALPVLNPSQSSAPGPDDLPDVCTTPLARGESGLESGTPSTGTPSTCGKQQTGPGAAAAATDEGWSFDTPTQRRGGLSDGWIKQPIVLTALTAAASSSPVAVAVCPRAGGLARVDGSATEPCAPQRGAASPATPSSLAACGGAAAPGSAVSTLGLSPDFSPHLPLPSVTLLTTHDISDVSGGGGGGASGAANSSDGSSGPAPQCTLVAARTEPAEAEGQETDSCPLSLGAAAAGPQRSAPPKKTWPLHKQEVDLRTPPPRTPLSSSNAANGAQSFRSTFSGSHPATGGVSTDSGAGIGSLMGQKSGVAARRSGAGAVVTPGSATACCAAKPSASASRRSSMGASDCFATGSGKKPRYQQSTVSSTMKKQHG